MAELLELELGMPKVNLSGILTEFENQTQNPPDPFIRDCYKAVLERYDKEDIKTLFSQVISHREINPKHFVNLFFRGIQYIELTKIRREDYPDCLKSPADWGKELELILSTYKDVFREILLRKDTQTTIYQRYAGPKAILSALFPGKDLVIADFGCGGNYGLRGIELNEPFGEIEDHSKEKIVTQLIHKRLPVGKGLAIDKEEPDNPNAKSWRLSCSFYPSELGKLASILAFEDRLKEAKRTSFLQKDIRYLTAAYLNGLTPSNSFDGVIISSVLYMMPDQQNSVLESAKSLLKPNGIVIIQDFAEKIKDSTKLNFDEDWFGRELPYRSFVASDLTGWEMKEIFKWTNGRCRKVIDGEDFEILKGGEIDVNT
ncbi:methyltransferase domain-containing protein [Candidatus Woesebacteria bacterium]|nr:methyltransferase domain-containing protein [Candidatus Woesebacteria bacterium]